LPEPVRVYYSIDPNPDKQWQQTPYTPRNGFGEIMVNLQNHVHSCPNTNKLTTSPVVDEIWRKRI
ncbi:MAG: hypothetical protein OEV64_11550, partial [Desulfobulbaceae bacterium]|nr:hypothetical protein [Desulfobulbaceae bacterium]